MMIWHNTCKCNMSHDTVPWCQSHIKMTSDAFQYITVQHVGGKTVRINIHTAEHTKLKA